MIKKTFFTLVMLINVCLSYAQANIEFNEEYPTGYISTKNPYYFGSLEGVLYVFNGRNPYILVRYPCTDSRESFVIPNTVVRIARGDFKNCLNLRDLVIPGSVIYIGDNAFDDSEISIFRCSDNEASLNFLIYEDAKTYHFDTSGKPISTPTYGINICVENGVAKKVMVK